MLTKIQNRRGGFTLVEIMIVVAIIALLAAIAVPSALRARKRSQATSTLETLRLLDGANDQWAIETGQSAGSLASAGTVLAVYTKTGTALYTELNGTGAVGAIGGAIAIPPVDSAPQLTTNTFNSL